MYITPIVKTECEGDFCGNCPLAVKRFKRYYCVKDNENEVLLRTKKVDLYRPEGYVAKRLLKPCEEPMRSRDCLANFPSRDSLYRRHPAAKKLYPSAREMNEGIFVPTSKYVDLHALAKAAPRSKIAVKFGYKDGMPVGFLSFRKSPQTIDLGTTTEMKLTELPPEGRSELFRWISTIQNELIDAEENVMFHTWLRDQE